MLAYGMNYMDRSVLGLIGEAMKTDMGLSDAQLGLVNSILLISLIFLVVPSAIANDVFKRRNMIGLATGIWGCAMAGTAAATGLFSLTLARVFAGVNEAVINPGSIAWLSQLYPASQRGRILGIFQMSSPLGMALGTLLGGVILALTGSWRLCFAVFILPAFALAFLIPRLPDSQAGVTGSMSADFRALLRKRSILITGLAVGFFSIIEYSYQTWMPVLLIRAYDIDVRYVGVIAAVFLVVGVFGSLLGGLFSDFRARRSPAGRTRAAALSIGLVVLSKAVFYHLMGRVSLPVLCVVGVIDGIILMMPIPMYLSIIQDVVSSRQRSSALGVMGMVCFVSGIAWGPLLAGALSEYFGGGFAGLLLALKVLLVFGVASSLILLSVQGIFLKEKAEVRQDC